MSPTCDTSGRHEIKFVLDALAFDTARAELDLHASALRRQFPVRRVQSLYFDDVRQSARRDGEEGLSERGKLRLRWYGAQSERVLARLEHKARGGELVFKRFVELSSAIDIEGASCARLVETVSKLVPPAWRAQLALAQRPVQWIAYEREYLCSASGLVRATIDQRLVASDQRFDDRITLRRVTPLPSLTIIELKAPPAALAELSEISSRLAARVEKCSKFALASQPRASMHGLDLE